jgi:hypothetical protein
MLIKKKVRSKSVAQGLKAFGVFFLLLAYVIGNSQLDTFHTFFHAHEEVVIHSPEQEADQCHRAIYHKDIEDGCEHKAHFTTYDKCNLCDGIFYNEHLSISNPSSELTNPSAALIGDVISFSIIEIVLYLPLRAPPIA